MKKLLIANLSVLVILVLLTGYNMLGNSGMFDGKPSGSESEKQPLYGAIKRDSMLDGKSIPFTVESKKSIGWETIHGSSTELQVFIARYPNELKIMNYLTFGENTTNYADEEKYNEEFFKENALIILTKSFGSGSYRMSVDSLVKKGNELCFYLIDLFPKSGVGTTDTLIIWNFIEVKKSDLSESDYNTISYFVSNADY